MINKKDPPRSNGKRDSRTGAVLPRRNFERYTGIPVTEFEPRSGCTPMVIGPTGFEPVTRACGGQFRSK
jgi:hypothetical protein